MNIKPFAEPTYTQVSNAALDHVMPAVSPALWKIICAVTRKTKGFHKTWDEISLTQLEQLTGMSRPTIVRGVQEGLETKILLRKSKGQGYTYRINDQYEIVTSKESLLVKESNQTSKDSLPELVKNLYTQKKERNLKDKDSSPNGAAPPQKKRADHIALEELEEIYCKHRPAKLPNWEKATQKQIKALQVRWRTPLRNIWKEADKDTRLAGQAVIHAIASMKADNLTIAAPQSIELTAISYIQDQAAGGVDEYTNVTAERRNTTED